MRDDGVCNDSFRAATEDDGVCAMTGCAMTVLELGPKDDDKVSEEGV